MLATAISTAVIDSLKSDPELSSWIHKGLELHNHRHGETCLFCNQPMPEGRIENLVLHFGNEYNKLMKEIDLQLESIDSKIRTIDSMQTIKTLEIQDDLSSEFESAISALNAETSATKERLLKYKNALATKKSRAFDKLDIAIIPTSSTTDAIENINRIIDTHNAAIDNFHSRIEIARKALEADFVASSLDEYEKKLQTQKNLVNIIFDLDQSIEADKNELLKIELDIIQHRRPAKELNDDIQSYLGHSELQFSISGTGYSIMRHNTRAVSLSEGETTAIALLYFLKSLEDHRFDANNGVVVLDDPVSSLDANSMYSAFGFIKCRTEKLSQIIILTHNFTFFSQIRYWYNHVNKNKNRKKVPNSKPARYFMITCLHGQDRRHSIIQRLDSMLEKFNSEYQYLFSVVHQSSMAPPQPQLDQYYTAPNIARKLLEAFLAFKMPDLLDLWPKLQNIDFDPAKKTRIIRFLNTYSHNSAIGDPEHDLSQLSETPSILKDLLELMRSQDEGHYSAMIKLVEQSNNDDA